MKRLFLSFIATLFAVMAVNAESFSGNIVITRNGQTYNQAVTVTVTKDNKGLNTFVLDMSMFGSITMYEVPSTTMGDLTVYNAERDVDTFLGTMRTTLFARTIDGMMAADVAIPAQNTTMWFNTVGDHFQLPNSDFEAWSADNGEPDRWHGFKTADGSFAGISAGLATLEQSNDLHSGATGSYSAVMTAGSLIGTVANGTMTNGQLIAGSMSATSTDNHAEMDKNKTNTDPNGDLFYMPLYAKPDKFNVWLKYTQGTANANNKANVSVKTFDGTYYQEPVDKVYTNLSGSIVGGQIPAGDWAFYSFPFDYDSYAANNAASEAIFVTFSTNGNPGSGSKNDKLYVDDIELIYLAEMTDLRYKGVTIDGWNPAVTTYYMEMTSEPNLNDFTATINGASATLTKSMEQNADGSYRIAICVVSGDLQTATSYIINVTVPNIKRGDVNGDGDITISDVTTLIDYLLTGDDTNVNIQNADVNADSSIGISDVTTLIDILLNGAV
jgi:hypothetical protein